MLRPAHRCQNAGRSHGHDIATFAPIREFTSPQSKPSGKKYFIMGRVETAVGPGMIANMPENFAVGIGSAVPGSGINK